MKTLAGITIGERDARLLMLRQALFGFRMTSTTKCPACSERLEWESNVSDLLVRQVDPPPDCASGASQRAADLLEITVEKYRIKCRLPNSDDLFFSAGQTDARVMRKQLIERCLIEATTEDGESMSFDQLSETALQAVVEKMETADPQANLQINLSCPACGHCWAVIFDIVSYLWAEIDAWAQRMLRTVHLLAKRYGWREVDILAMSPMRRQIYLEMARQ